MNITIEDSTNLARIDMLLTFNEQVYIFEFTVVELVPDGEALQRVKDKVSRKFIGLGQPVYLIGVEFSKDNRNCGG